MAITMRKLLLAGAVLTTLAGPAFAGPQYVDQSGFAVSGHDVVAYWDLKQAPIGQTQPKAVPGNKAFTADHNGAKWAFASAANRDRFVKDPAKFAPAYDGHCAYGVAFGGKVPANPNLWRIVDGRLYLNITKNVVGLWEKDVPGNITKANANWSGLEKTESPSKNVPDFDSSGAPIAQ